MFGLSFVEKATRLTVESLKPLFDVRQPKLERITDSNWRSPYALGFVSFLITLQARKLCGPEVKGDKSGAITLKVWPQLTGNSSEGLGTQLYQLALAGEKEFGLGADNAGKLFRVMWGRPDMSDPVVASAVVDAKVMSKSVEFLFGKTDSPDFGLAAYALWRQLFLEQFLSPEA